MKIDKTKFGSITVAGKTYEHDVVIRLSDKVVKRKKKLSKRLYGTSHTISEDEARFVFEKGCKELILGTGQYGNAALSAGGRRLSEEEGLQGHRQSDPEGDQDLQPHAQAQGRAVPRDLLASPAAPAGEPHRGGSGRRPGRPPMRRIDRLRPTPVPT